ncbi:unnamed protein product [Alternaria alternata]
MPPPPKRKRPERTYSQDDDRSGRPSPHRPQNLGFAHHQQQQQQQQQRQQPARRRRRRWQAAEQKQRTRWLQRSPEP